MDIILSEPTSDLEFTQYFDFRWRLLRSPWQQSRGSEQDSFDSRNNANEEPKLVVHVMALNFGGEILGVGRIHQLNSKVAQIRYMAVEKQFRRLGVAGTMLRYLESIALEWEKSKIILNARENIMSFYTGHDYKLAGPGELLFNKVPHVKMYKKLRF